MKLSEIVDYIFDNGLEMDFYSQVMMHKGGYSIMEIGDAKFVRFGGEVQFKSENFKLSIAITDDDIITAVNNRLYISSFIARMNEDYQVSFFVHNFPTSMKERFEERLAKDVMRYMISNAVFTLKLDSIAKVKEYIGV